jgi:hypothetical protein
MDAGAPQAPDERVPDEVPRDIARDREAPSAPRAVSAIASSEESRATARTCHGVTGPWRCPRAPM